MIVDGQQRLTSLYAVLKGKEIDQRGQRDPDLRISFNPLTEEFAVADAPSERPRVADHHLCIWNSPKGEFGLHQQLHHRPRRNSRLDR